MVKMAYRYHYSLGILECHDLFALLLTVIIHNVLLSAVLDNVIFINVVELEKNTSLST